MRYTILALALAFSIVSCSKQGTGRGQIPEEVPAASFLDLSYGADSQQKLDLYLPENRDEDTRTIVIIHGGGWSAGDKSDFNSYIKEFQRRLPDVALANLNYRLVTSSGNFFPTQEMDIGAAMNFLHGKTDDYGISKDFILLGISAGAHLALLQGYKHGDVIKPRGIISFFGPVDLPRLYEFSDESIPDVLVRIMNATLDSNPDIFVESSPINYVDAGDPPTLMLHGDQDMLVPVEQAYLLRDKLVQAGVRNELVVYPGQGHGWFGPELEDSFEKITSFIRGLEN